MKKEPVAYPYPHKHVVLPCGAVATVDVDCPQETLDALNKLAEAAYYLKIKK